MNKKKNQEIDAGAQTSQMKDATIKNYNFKIILYHYDLLFIILGIDIF